ncbi:hypothetical protein J3A84_11590 [Proteiniclasticum sp. SCR006]|uniref:Uncharacterized protein n=1 Tax=Proteiniclasticum aestuarii TaxID=2817862 RepID=A0A939HCX1_9CLOT|nr:hypothetical protein [Proteiniclasticum aestuarii]MBO1265672.1 hypothetical protein [Proteiniclasticum aestuarii]
MNHIDRYIYAVVKYLPEKDRAEIAEELRANIYDMLGGDRSEENIVRTLEDMGSPFRLALSYMGTEQYLIGPKVYHLYLEVLKIVALAAVIIGVLTFTLELITEVGSIRTIADVVALIIGGFATVFNVLVGFLFWVTVVFVIIEKTDSADEMIHSMDKPFRVSSLKDVPNLERKKISKVEMVVSLIFTIVFLYLFVYRNELIAVYTQSETIRIFNADIIARYRFLLLFSGAFSIMVSILKLIYGRWNELLGVISSVDALVNLGVTILVLTNERLFTAGFLEFMEGLWDKIGINLDMNIQWAVRGFLALVLIATLVEIGTSLYYGFRKVNTKSK